jgi:hypothetical protein
MRKLWGTIGHRMFRAARNFQDLLLRDAGVGLRLPGVRRRSPGGRPIPRQPATTGTPSHRAGRVVPGGGRGPGLAGLACRAGAGTSPGTSLGRGCGLAGRDSLHRSRTRATSCRLRCARLRPLAGTSGTGEVDEVPGTEAGPGARSPIGSHSTRATPMWNRAGHSQAMAGTASHRAGYRGDDAAGSGRRASRLGLMRRTGCLRAAEPPSRRTAHALGEDLVQDC